MRPRSEGPSARPTQEQEHRQRAVIFDHTRAGHPRRPGLANARRHELATLEHLLLALIDEPDAARVMKACSVNLDELRKTLVDFIDDDLSTLVTDVEGSEAVPTAAFQRVIQRAAIHVQSSGRTEVTGRQCPGRDLCRTGIERRLFPAGTGHDAL
jgi:hypothetical protein